MFPGRGRPRQELLGELVCGPQRLVVRRDVLSVVLEHVRRDRDRLVLLERAELDQLEDRRHLGALGEQPLRVLGCRLADDRQRAGRDGGEDGVEKATWVARVLARPQRFLQPRKVPDHRLSPRTRRRGP